MNAIVLLCDNAQVVNGKLYILGASWSLTGPTPVTMGVAVQITLPLRGADIVHTWRLSLLDSEGRIATWVTPSGAGYASVSGRLPAKEVIGALPNTDAHFVYALNLTAIPLNPGAQYEFRIFIDDATQDGWRANFEMRPNLPLPPLPIGPPPILK